MTGNGERWGLVGHTGFVGTTLRAQRGFDGLFNSANIGDLAGQRFDTLVCAGAPAAMWAANEHPARDKANLARLAQVIRQADVARLVLISTTAVFDDPAAGYTESAARFEAAKAYGRHRRALEQELAAHAARCHIIRLPALFGPGLRKNFMFDLINPVPSFLRAGAYADLPERLGASTAARLQAFYSYAEPLAMWALDRAALDADPVRPELEVALDAVGLSARQFTNSESRFQYYNMALLARDIERTIAHDLPVLNVCSQPLRAGHICEALTGSSFQNHAAALVNEDIRSDFAELWGGPAPYLYSAAEVLADLQAFFVSERRA